MSPYEDFSAQLLVSDSVWSSHGGVEDEKGVV